MAEKKVSGKQKNNTNKTSTADASKSLIQQSEYDAFVSQYGQDLRRRSTRTVPEPKKNRIRTAEFDSARCGEMNPHTTVNPAAEHQIFTKRTGRVISDDTGFKAMNYNDRFELKPEMPELDASQAIDAQGGFDDTSVPGQQTMADIVSESDCETEISVPVESKINNDENAFELVYKAMRNETGITFGKSEKLRAIARTAADDVGMAPDSQLTFPAFSPLFKFPEEENKNKSKKNNRKIKHKEPKTTDFDIEESEIVTVHPIENQEKDDVSADIVSKHQRNKNRAKRIFDTINNEAQRETEPDFEVAFKSDIPATIKNLKTVQLTEIVKTAVLFLLGIVSGIISAVASTPESTVNLPAVSIIFLLLSGVVCIKEVIIGIKDILKLKLSHNFGGVLILLFALLQSVIATFSENAELVHILAPSVIFSLMFITLPKILLLNNSKTTISVFDKFNDISIFKPLSESGIEGAVNSKFGDNKKQIYYNIKTEFVTGLMKKLANAIPKPFAGNTMFVFAVVFAVITGIAAGIKSGSFVGVITGFESVLICCIPMTYTLCSAVLLFVTNKKLEKKRSNIISYQSAAELTQTKAVVFNDNDIIESASCNIHGVKFFGNTDPKEASLCCAAAMNSADMPLSEIMKKIIEQSEDEIPQADDYILNDKGVAAIYDNKRILLGTKEFLTENHVYVPAEDFHSKYITGDRKLLFLSVNGEFCMLLIVSYHIKRSVSNFFKYLAKKHIDILVYSCDPNITGEYIAKKCKLKNEVVVRLNETETAYFKDKNSKTESSLPAQVFTDGNPTSVFAVFKNAFFLSKVTNVLPLVVFALLVINALLITIPVILGNILALNNVYVMVMKAISVLIGIGVPMFIFKEK